MKESDGFSFKISNKYFLEFKKKRKEAPSPVFHLNFTLDLTVIASFQERTRTSKNAITVKGEIKGNTRAPLSFQNITEI